MSQPRDAAELPRPASDDALEASPRPAEGAATPLTPRVARGEPRAEPSGTPAPARAEAASGSASARAHVAPTLRVFGALLWAYVVLGEWVVGLNLPEPLAVLLVLAVFARSWARAVSDDPRPLHLGKLEPGIYALALWAAALLLGAAVPGGNAPARVEAIGALLWFVAAGSHTLGGRWQLRRIEPPSRWTRALGLAVPVVAALGTALAALSALQRL